MEVETSRPRFCHLRKVPDYDGYGFKLCAKKGKAGQFIKVDPGSPAEAAGLRDGDRIVEVNGANVNNENHGQVNCHSIVATGFTGPLHYNNNNYYYYYYYYCCCCCCC